MDCRTEGAKLLDDIDLDLVAALQIAPRAPINALAEVIGSSPTTAARRMSRLQSEKLLRVVGQVDWSLTTTGNPHHIWIRCKPGHVQEVAAHVAGLEEVQTLMITTGSADLYCSVDALLGTDMFDLLTRRLPSHHAIVSTQSELVLKARSVSHSWRLRRLTDVQEAELAKFADEVSAAPLTGLDQLSAMELQVLQLLAADGRTSAAEVARELGLSRSAAYRMTQSLITTGAVRPRVEIEPATLGFPLLAITQLAVRPKSMPEVLQHLSGHPCSRQVSMVTGSSSILHHGVFRDEGELAEFVSTGLANFPGISGINTSIVLRVLRRNGIGRQGDYLGEALPGFPARLFHAPELVTTQSSHAGRPA